MQKAKHLIVNAHQLKTTVHHMMTKTQHKITELIQILS